MEQPRTNNSTLPAFALRVRRRARRIMRERAASASAVSPTMSLSSLVPARGVPATTFTTSALRDGASRMRTARVLILMSNTGGGHRASAEALRAGFEQQFGDRFHITILDPLIDNAQWPLNQLDHIYFYMANHAPWAWGLLWRTTHLPLISMPSYAASMLSLRKPMRDLLAEHAPDLVICVHPLVQQVFSRVFRTMAAPPPCVTVVTDPVTPHVLWFRSDVQLCFVATRTAYEYGRRAGLRPAQLRNFGLPIRPGFGRQRPPATELRQTLEMDPTLPAVLIMGGGDGVGPVDRIAQRVAHVLHTEGKPLGQIVIVCGRNRQLKRRLEARHWPIPVRICGFVENMPDWMAACDCIITKAGPGTIAEAQAMGLPIIISSYIPGQEAGNVLHVVEHGGGEYSEDPDAIARIVHHWFAEDPDALQQAAQRSAELGRPQATRRIVQEIVHLLDETP